MVGKQKASRWIATTRITTTHHRCRLATIHFSKFAVEARRVQPVRIIFELPMQANSKTQIAKVQIWREPIYRVVWWLFDVWGMVRKNCIFNSFNCAFSIFSCQSNCENKTKHLSIKKNKPVWIVSGFCDSKNAKKLKKNFHPFILSMN